MAAYYTFEDLSGAAANTTKSENGDVNPYQDLIESCNHDPKQIQQRYSTHRINRNAQQKSKLLAPDFPGVTVDPILAKLENPKEYPDYQDPRHCLVFWARPTLAVRNLISKIQTKLKKVVPHLWIMPSASLHMTALEIAHSLTAREIDDLVQQMEQGRAVQDMCDYTWSCRPRLVKPMVSFDSQALALSWLPAGDEEDGGTYHDARRELWAMARGTGVAVASRYVVPSAHLTIARFVQRGDLEDGEGRVQGAKVAELVRTIEEVNEWLEGECWGSVEWVVGEEKGLEFRKGALWYGAGGETVKVGKGF